MVGSPASSSAWLSGATTSAGIFSSIASRNCWLSGLSATAPNAAVEIIVAVRAVEIAVRISFLAGLE